MPKPCYLFAEDIGVSGIGLEGTEAWPPAAPNIKHGQVSKLISGGEHEE